MSLLQELNINYMKNRSDPARKDRARKQIISTFRRIYWDTNGDMVVEFSSPSGTRPGVVHHQYVHLKDMSDALHLPADLSTMQRVNIALRSDVRVRCGCEDFGFSGGAYILTVSKSIYGDDEIRYPHIKNPGLKGMLCKHLISVLKVLPANASSIAKEINDKYLRPAGKTNAPAGTPGKPQAAPATTPVTGTPSAKAKAKWKAPQAPEKVPETEPMGKLAKAAQDFMGTPGKDLVKKMVKKYGSKGEQPPEQEPYTKPSLHKVKGKEQKPYFEPKAKKVTEPPTKKMGKIAQVAQDMGAIKTAKDVDALIKKHSGQATTAKTLKKGMKSLQTPPKFSELAQSQKSKADRFKKKRKK
jgi:hypothetical protein